jgi:hypothetical protein
MTETPEWTQFATIGPGVDSSTMSQLNTVYHVTHLRSAPTVIEDGKIVAGVVFDESKLNTERILVTWLSPNYWNLGFRYGNICFLFDFQSLIQGMNSYWVESIAYQIPAPRILLTDKDYSGRLEPYDATRGDGPWYHDVTNDSHYWNGQYCLELMVERDLWMNQVAALDYVRHHNSYCSIAPNSCPDCGKLADVGAAEFLASLLGRDAEMAVSSRGLFVNTDGAPTDALTYAARSLFSRFSIDPSIQYVGNIKLPCLALSRAVFASYAHARDQAETHQLAGWFASQNAFYESGIMLMESYFNISGLQPIVSGTISPTIP